jgi:hypothetical protein
MRNTWTGKMRMLWRRRPDSNRGIAVLQTAALPLGYAAFLSNFHEIPGDFKRHPLRIRGKDYT